MKQEVRVNNTSRFFGYFFKFSSINIIIALTSAATNLFFAKFLAPQIFTDYFGTISVVLILSNLLPLGLIGAITIFKAHLTELQHDSLLKFTLFLTCTLGLLALTLYSGWHNFSYTKTLRFLPVISYTVFYCCILALNTYFQVSDQFRRSIILTVLSQSLLLVMLGLWYYLALTLTYYFLIASVALLLAILISVGRKNWLALRSSPMFPSEILRILHYAVPSGVQSSIVSFVLVGDRILADNYYTKIDALVYLEAALAASYILFIINNYANAVGIFFVDQRINMKDSEYFDFFKTGSSKTAYMVLLFIPYIPITLLFSWILDVDRIWEFLAICNILTIAYCVNGATKFYLGALGILEKSGVVLFTVIATLCTLLVVFFLTKNLGIYSLALAVLIANLTFFCGIRIFAHFYMSQLVLANGCK